MYWPIMNILGRKEIKGWIKAHNFHYCQKEKFLRKACKDESVVFSKHSFGDKCLNICKICSQGIQVAWEIFLVW